METGTLGEHPVPRQRSKEEERGAEHNPRAALLRVVVRCRFPTRLGLHRACMGVGVVPIATVRALWGTVAPSWVLLRHTEDLCALAQYLYPGANLQHRSWWPHRQHCLQMSGSAVKGSTRLRPTPKM